MASAAVEKTAEELRKEIAELQRQQWEITERLRNPRGLRRAGAGAGGPRLRGVIRPAPELEEQPVSKRRLSSAVVKVDGEESKDDSAEAEDPQVQEPPVEVGASLGGESNRVTPGSEQINGGSRRDGNIRLRKMDYDAIPTETVPRVLPKEDDPNLVKRNRKMLGGVPRGETQTSPEIRDEEVASGQPTIPWAAICRSMQRIEDRLAKLEVKIEEIVAKLEAKIEEIVAKSNQSGTPECGRYDRFKSGGMMMLKKLAEQNLLSPNILLHLGFPPND